MINLNVQLYLWFYTPILYILQHYNYTQFTFYLLQNLWKVIWCEEKKCFNGLCFGIYICFAFWLVVIIWHHNLHVACKLFFLANESFLPNIAEWKMEALFLFSFSLTHTNTLTFFYTPFCFLSNDLAKTCVKPFRKRFEAISSMIKYKTLESIL